MGLRLHSPGPSLDDVKYKTHSPFGPRAILGSCAFGVQIEQPCFVYGPYGLNDVECVTIELVSAAHTLQPSVNSAENLEFELVFNIGNM
jgi:hypothetical protein